ncbi:hypothetical protein [Pseudomonas hunanensis]|uniref:hypothetical protein n=1 Tax=Pseudomonas hunanensis TaxID=1247546 RepID=UPI002AA0B9F6|nr:hypothetical protein [Pseudomonas hunanensis]HDS0957249.1 hypothetical protein [Pseudomonas putida]
MEERLSSPISNILREPNSAWAEQQFLSHIRGLENQGLPPLTILRVMARLLFEFWWCQYHKSIGDQIWLMKFLRDTGRDFIQQEGFVSSAEELDSLQQEYLEDVEPLGYA